MSGGGEGVRGKVREALLFGVVIQTLKNGGKDWNSAERFRKLGGKIEVREVLDRVDQRRIRQRGSTIE